MASVRYNLRSKNTNPSVIMGRLYYDGGEFVFSTRYSINPKNRNRKKTASPSERFFEDINQYMVEEESRLMELYEKLRREGIEITNDTLRKCLEGTDPATSLYSHIQNVIRHHESNGKKAATGRIIACCNTVCPFPA